MNETQDITETGEFRLLESIIEFGEKLNPYVEAVCIGRPLDLPNFNTDTEQWEVFFEESATPWHPYDEIDIISVSLADAEEACEVYNHYNNNPVME